MVTSLRLPQELDLLLDAVSKQMGQTRSEVIRAAIEKYCREVTSESTYSMYDRLMQAGFRPGKSNSKDRDLASNKEKQRKIISERITRNNFR